MFQKQTNKEILSKKELLLVLAMAAGILARFAVMTFGYNFDFESYKIVGEIVSRGGNVYAETTRYNYGFIFFLLQGLLYKISLILNPDNIEWTYRIGMVSLLTLTDLGISFWISQQYSKKLGVIFFLNPISVIITGFHNQFDNIAVLFALTASCFVDEESEKLTKNDFIALTLLSLSLITKHICFAFFMWLFFRKAKMNLVKRLTYTCAPFGIFLLSFIPFVCGNKNAFEGMMQNVFLYRSHNNYPVFRYLFKLIPFPQEGCFLLYLLIMLIIGLGLRKLAFREMLLMYLIAMVSFSSAVANQYLIIPIAGLIICEKKRYFIIYELLGTIYFLVNGNELHLASRIAAVFPKVDWFIARVAEEGGMMVVFMTWILAFVVIMEVIKINRVGAENG